MVYSGYNKHDHGCLCYNVGVCEKYRVLHDQCGPFEQINGHCGCGTGMVCQWVPDTPLSAKPLSNLIVSRKLPGHSEPGAYRCALV